MTNQEGLSREGGGDTLSRLASALADYFQAVRSDPQTPEAVRARADTLAVLLRDEKKAIDRALSEWRGLRDRIVRTRDELAGVESLMGKLVSTLEEEEWPPGG